MAQIPTELLTIILSHVPVFPNYLIMRRVCHLWQNVLEQQLFEHVTILDLWPRNTTKYISPSFDMAEYKYLAQLFPKIHTLFVPNGFAICCAKKPQLLKYFCHAKAIHILPSQNEYFPTPKEFVLHFDELRLYGFKSVAFGFVDNTTAVYCHASKEMKNRVPNMEHCFESCKEQDILQWLQYAKGMKFAK